MEDLLNQQAIVKGKIAQFESNYNKDGSSRKTKKYLETKIEQLKALYTEFVRTDEQIYEFVPPIDKNHAYTNERAAVASTYKKLIEEMRQLLNNGPSLTPTLSRSQHLTFPQADESNENSQSKTKVSTDQSTNSTLSQLLRRQEGVIEGHSTGQRRVGKKPRQTTYTNHPAVHAACDKSDS